MNAETSVLKPVFAALRPRDPIQNGQLTILPFTTGYRCRARYVLLPQAIARGRLTVTEVSEGGSVPHLRAVNHGPWPVLLFDGEELIGAKQNRIVNATTLLSVGKSILPVSCVEEGRWSARSPAFAAGAHASHPALRREKELQVGQALAMEPPRSPDELSQQQRAARYRADQGAVWAEVAERSLAAGARSDTGAMADAYRTRTADLETVLAPFLAEDGCPPVEGMVAAAVFLGSRFVCFDALWPEKRFAQVYPKLLRGYALEALSVGGNSPARPADPEGQMLRLFGELADAPVTLSPGVDLGRDARVECAGARAAGLVWEKRMLQLSVFPA